LNASIFVTYNSMRKTHLLVAVCSAMLLSACNKSEVYVTPSLSDYYPLKVGSYITYQLDSTVFVNFGTVRSVKSYQVKHAVDAQITDNLGRPAYRIIRYIRVNPTDPWVPDNTFMAVPTQFTMEFIENNLRFIKMKEPLVDGYTWKGNSYIDTYSLNSDIKYLDNWDYTYDSMYLPAKIGALTIDSTIKVEQRNEVIGNPSNPNSYSEINIGEEKYAKGIGMIYRYFLHTEYQPPTPGHVGAYSDGSYGVRLTMIDHN
jgi:hypothetical protein